MPRPLAGCGATPLRLALSAALGLSAFCCHAAAGDGRLFVTNSGAQVRIEPVGGLDCKRLEAKLAEIDRTGYRGGSPTPRHADDGPLLGYEGKVARALYNRCGRRTTGDDAAPALRGARWGQGAARE